MQNANNILFRASGNGNMMIKPQGKSNKEKYDEAIINRTKYQNDYNIIGNKDTKAAQHKLQKIKEINTLILELENSKNEVEISEGHRKFLLQTYAAEVHGRRTQISSKYLKKGNAREQDALTLLSRVKQKVFNKNTERLRNEYFQGEPDAFDGKEIRKAKEIRDTKASWSLETFLESKHKPINPMYEWQGHTYMSLTGAEMHHIDYCLVNGLAKAINDEKRKLAWEMGVLDMEVENDPAFVKGCKQIEINHIFDIHAFCIENPGYEFHNEIFIHNNGADKKFIWDYDIPFEQRVHTKSFARDEYKIAQLQEQVIVSREWLNKEMFFYSK